MKRNQKPMENDNAIFIVKGLCIGGEASDDIVVGYIDDETKASSICEKLTKENEDSVDRWNSWCVNCKVSNTSNPKKKDVEDVIQSGCPFASNVRIEQHGNNKELLCDNCAFSPEQYTYIIEKVQKICL